MADEQKVKGPASYFPSIEKTYWRRRRSSRFICIVPGGLLEDIQHHDRY